MRNVVTICVCVTPEMEKRIRKNAGTLGMSVSGYINLLLRLGETRINDGGIIDGTEDTRA